MSWELVSAAWKVRGLKPAEKIALLYMSDVARNPAHEFYENHEKTAESLEISERYLSACKKKFIELGHISKIKSQHRVAADGIRDRYKIHPVTVKKSVPTSANSSPVTSELCDTDKGTLTPGQVNFNAPTGELCDTPNITIRNQSNLKGNQAPPPLPSQLPSLINAQKSAIAKLRWDDPRQDALHQKLWEYEKQLHGAQTTKRKAAPSQMPQSDNLVPIKHGEDTAKNFREMAAREIAKHEHQP